MKYLFKWGPEETRESSPDPVFLLPHVAAAALVHGVFKSRKDFANARLSELRQVQEFTNLIADHIPTVDWAVPEIRQFVVSALDDQEVDLYDDYSVASRSELVFRLRYYLQRQRQDCETDPAAEIVPGVRMPKPTETGFRVGDEQAEAPFTDTHASANSGVEELLPSGCTPTPLADVITELRDFIVIEDERLYRHALRVADWSGCVGVLLEHLGAVLPPWVQMEPQVLSAESVLLVLSRLDDLEPLWNELWLYIRTASERSLRSAVAVISAQASLGCATA